MKKVLLLFILIVPIIAKAQYAAEPLKEVWDDKILHLLDINDPTSYANMLNVNSNNEMFSNMAGVASGELEMYRTTLDKGYLIKFINQSLQILSLRVSNCSEWQPSYDNGTPNMFYDAVLSGRLAEFCYLVLAEPPYNSMLQNEPLPLASNMISIPPIPTSPSHIYCNVQPTSSDLQTYGTYAKWLATECKKTIEHYYNNDFYDASEGFLQDKRSNSSCTDNWNSNSHYQARAINQEAYYAVTMLYLNQLPTNVNNSGGIYDIPLDIARRYKGTVDIYHQGYWYTNSNGVLHYEPRGCNSYPVLNINTAYNSYWWYHAGWGSPYFNPNFNSCGCVKDKTGYYQFVEDLGHAVWTMEFPLQAHKILANTYFDLNDMIRFHNTASKNVIQANNAFEPAINGNPNAPLMNRNDNHSNTVFTLMGYYPYDNADATATPSLYDLVMQYYYFRLNNGTFHNAAGGENKFSTLVKAQWEKECPSLTLYNRDLVYNQDFFAKRSLTIAPEEITWYHHASSPSFAEPVINTPDFIVEASVQSNITAEESITLKSGTNFKAGSNVHVMLQDNCSSIAFKKQTENNTNSIKNIVPVNKPKNKIENVTDAIAQFNIYPNPTSSETKLTFLLNSPQKINIYMFNSLGQLVKTIAENEKGNTGIVTYTIKRDELSSGVYQLQLKTESGIINKQIVIQ